MSAFGLAMLLVVAVAPQPPTAQEIEAAITRGDFDDAEAALADASLDAKIRRRLLGALRYRQGRFDDAEALFVTALNDTPNDALVRLYLATTRYEREHYAAALVTVDEFSPPSTLRLQTALLRARILSALHRPAAADAELVRIQTAFPDDTRPRFERIVLAVHEDQLEIAISHADAFLQMGPPTGDLVVVGHLLASTASALPLLERMLATAPHDVDLLKVVASSYASAQLPRAAAERYAAAEMTAPGTAAAEAADQFLRAQDTRRALTFNARVHDVKRRLPQRLRILFEDGHWARVVAMTPALRAEGLLDPTARYQLAYAHYVLNDTVKAAEWARSLKGTSLEAAGAAVLEALGIRPKGTTP